MRKIKIFSFIVGIVSILFICVGCSGSTHSITEQKFKNLNMENTVVIDTPPSSGSWKSICFNSIRFTEDTQYYVDEIAKNFNNSAIDNSRLQYRVSLGGAFYGPEAGDTKDVFASEMSNERYENSLFVKYKDENVYVEAMSGLGLAEMYNPRSVTDILSIESNFSWSWKPEISGYVVNKVEPNSETDFCILNGEKVCINDAVACATAALNAGNQNRILTDGLKVNPIKAEIYDFPDCKNQGLSITFELVYDGIPIEGNRVSTLTLDENDDENKGKSILEYPVYACMLTKDSIDWLRVAPARICDDLFHIEDTQILIDYDKACSILSSIMSDEVIFNVAEARLMYAVTSNSEDGYNTDSYEISPKWRFHLTDVKAQEYRELYVYINADNGLYSISRPY